MISLTPLLLIISFLMPTELWSGALETIALEAPSDLPEHLDSENPILAARALSRLRQMDRNGIPQLARSLNKTLSPRSRALVENHLDLLLKGILEELDSIALELEVARSQPTEDASNAETILQKSQLRQRFLDLLEMGRSGGPFLAASIAGHLETISSSSRFLPRVYRRLQGELLQSWLQQNPTPQISGLTPAELRWLSTLTELAGPELSQGFWTEMMDSACMAAWSDLASFDPVLEHRGRKYFLDMGPEAVEFLQRQISSAEELGLPENLIREWQMQTRLRLSADFDGSHAISLSGWDELSGEKHLERLIRLMGVLGDEILPTLYHVATIAPDPVLRRRSAEFMSLLGDRRGARILLLDRRYGAERLEAASRDAILRAANLLRDSGDLSGARLLLEDLNERLPHDASARHALGLVLLRERNLPASIRQFRRSLELDASRSTAHYNLACALALSNQLEEAIDSLEMAIEMGYDRFSHAVKDADLQSLHNSSRFWDLIPKAFHTPEIQKEASER